MSSVQTDRAAQWCNAITEWYHMHKAAAHSWFKYCLDEGYCDSNGIETEFGGVKRIAAELEHMCESDFIDVDPGFPLPIDISARRNEAIAYVLRYCYVYGRPPTKQNVIKDYSAKMKALLPVNENEQYDASDVIPFNQQKQFKMNPNAKAFVVVHSTKQVTEPRDDINIVEQKIDNSKPGALKKRKKRKKPKPKRYSDGCEVYQPNAEKRLQGIIQMPYSFTEKYIPNTILETSIASIAFLYLDRSVAMQYNDGQAVDIMVGNGKTIQIYNVDLHDKNTKQLLYLLVQKQDPTKAENRDYKWRSIGLFSADEIQKQFHDSIYNLPVSSRSNNVFLKQLNCRPLRFDEMRQIVKTTHWHKINVLHKIENKIRRTLSVDKLQFIEISLNEIKDKNGSDIVPLIPMVLFENNINFVGHLYILKLVDDHIGVLLEYEETEDTFAVRNIHLNKDMIELHHKLAIPGHACDCIICMDGFKSNSDALSIGNPDKILNQFKDLKNKYETSNDIYKQYEQMKEFCKLVAQCGNEKLAQKAQYVLGNESECLINNYK